MPMPIEQEPIETVKKGWSVVDKWSGTLVAVRKVRIEGEKVVLEIGAAFCLEIEGDRGSTIGVWRRRRRRKERQENETASRSDE